MARKKRRPPSQAESESAPAPKPAAIGTAFGPLLQRAGLQKLPPPAPAASTKAATSAKPPRPAVAPPPRAAAPPAAVAPPAAPERALSPREESLLHQAYAGVAPIARPKRGRIERGPRTARGSRAEAPEEQAARERLAALVGGGVRFEIARDDDLVAGVRERAAPKLIGRLAGSGFSPEAELDLHGLRSADVGRAVGEFVRNQQRRGVRYVLLITGKGHHSEGGQGVLRDAAIAALTEGGAAPFVLAFTTPHPRHGGSGALAVMLG